MTWYMLIFLEIDCNVFFHTKIKSYNSNIDILSYDHDMFFSSYFSHYMIKTHDARKKERDSANVIIDTQ